MALDAADQRVVDAIEEHGFFSQGVLADANGPVFRYSIGFWESLRAPEVIIFGLDLQLMHNMLWTAFRQIKAGTTLVGGYKMSGLIEGFDCVARPVHPTQVKAHFGVGLWYRRYRGADDNLQAFQLFWPGKVEGLYPWEAGCPAEVRALQPQLYLPLEAGLA